MKRLLFVILSAATSLHAFASPPEEDRRAILKMAGKFDVSFDFKEVVPINAPKEPLSPPYHEEAHEVVIVAEDTPERIVLQHLLVVEHSSMGRMVIKHWAQVWTWQDTDLLDYSGRRGSLRWNHVKVTPEQAGGKWSQLVTSVDDSPRYEALGKWTHDHGVSSWTSEATRRPLPRREYEESKRSDYDYLSGTNRHTITPDGWAHFQDSRKVVDRDGKDETLTFESGLNYYKRNDTSPLSTEAEQWWEKNSAFWNVARNVWLEETQKAGAVFTYQTTVGEAKLGKKFRELEAAKADKAAILSALSPFLVQDKK